MGQSSKRNRIFPEGEVRREDAQGLPGAMERRRGLLQVEGWEAEDGCASLERGSLDAC